MPKKVWVLHVIERGSVIHAGVFRNKRKAVKDLARYLKDQEGYKGSEDLPSISDWMAEHNERPGVDLFPAPVDLS